MKPAMSYCQELTAWRHPDRLEALFGLRLEVLRSLVEYVGGLMHPTPLPEGLALDMAQRFPKTQRSIPNGQSWPLLEPATFSSIAGHFDLRPHLG
jgi:hypothetical protein